MIESLFIFLKFEFCKDPKLGEFISTCKKHYRDRDRFR
jgi:hypothetical protein